MLVALFHLVWNNKNLSSESQIIDTYLLVRFFFKIWLHFFVNRAHTNSFLKSLRKYMIYLNMYFFYEEQQSWQRWTSSSKSRVCLCQLSPIKSPTRHNRKNCHKKCTFFLLKCNLMNQRYLGILFIVHYSLRSIVNSKIYELLLHEK